MDTHKRSIAKAVSWRIIATIVTMALVLIFTGSLALAGTVGFFDVVLKLIIYYLHERSWSKISWGVGDAS